MNRMQEQVREFHQAFGVECPKVPTMPDKKTQELREKLILEELHEFFNSNAAGDLVAAADAIADMAYVVIGAAIAYGIDLQPVFDEVHRSNMSKLWTFDETMAHKPKDNSECLTFIGIGKGSGLYVAKRADGKVKKPASHSRPDILGVLRNQREGKTQCNTES